MHSLKYSIKLLLGNIRRSCIFETEVRLESLSFCQNALLTCTQKPTPSITSCFTFASSYNHGSELDLWV